MTSETNLKAERKGNHEQMCVSSGTALDCYSPASDSPGETLAVEVNRVRNATLDQPVGIDAIAVELKSSIVQHEINPSPLELRHLLLPDLIEVVAQDVLLRLSKVLSASRLQILDIVLGHVDQEAQISGIAPQADLRELVEDELGRLELLLL